MNEKIHYTDLVCLNCGNIVTIQRIVGRFKNIGHIKDLYCSVCKSTQKHYEVQDADLFKLKYLSCLKKSLTPEENELLTIIKGKEENARKKSHVSSKKSSKR